VRGKWAAGIPPRYFTWVIKGHLAASERPGGYARNHRRVRRQEEIIWIREQGFHRVVSLLPTPHNLHAYDELGVRCEHLPFPAQGDPRDVLEDFYKKLREWLGAGEKVLVHYEEFGDRLQGVLAGYLVYGGLIPDAPKAIAVLEELTHRQMGPVGRELVALTTTLPS
jgi:hypothetical protein